MNCSFKARLGCKCERIAQVVFDLQAAAPASDARESAREPAAAEPGVGLKDGIAWPTPEESPPFWERPARTTPLTLGAPVTIIPQLKHVHTLELPAARRFAEPVVDTAPRNA